MTTFMVGDRVRLLARGEYIEFGEIGTVANIITMDDGGLVYYVRFRPEEPDWPHNFQYHPADELEAPFGACRTSRVLVLWTSLDVTYAAPTPVPPSSRCAAADPAPQPRSGQTCPPEPTPGRSPDRSANSPRPTKLAAEVVAAICADYATGRWSQADLAYIYGVSQPTVHKYVTAQRPGGN